MLHEISDQLHLHMPAYKKPRTDDRVDAAAASRLLDRANEQIQELDALLLDSTPERFAQSD